MADRPQPAAPEPSSPATAKPLDDTTRRRLLAARHLFRLAADQAGQGQDIPALAASNLLQDAVEMFLLAAAGHLDADVGRRDDFDKIIGAVDHAHRRPLPFRRRLLDLNQMRVNSKHRGLLPHRRELAGLLTMVREYLGEACTQVFGQSFWTLSVADGIERADVRAQVLAAESAYVAGDYRTALIAIRRAFFIVFEVPYDTRVPSCARYFSDPGHPWDGSGPDWRVIPEEQREYRLKEPFDYIYIDWAHLGEELRRDRIDPVAFENILNTTPRVYYLGPELWLTRDDHVLAGEDLKARVADALALVPDMILRRQARYKAVKPQTFGYDKALRLSKRGASVYLRARRDSEVVGRADEFGPMTTCYGEVPSFDGNDVFYAFFPDGALELVYILKEEADLIPDAAALDREDLL